MKKRIISLFLAVFMIVGMLPISAIPAFAEGGVTYLEYNTETGKFDELACTDYTPLADGVTEWTDGWYVAPAGKLELGGVNVNGSAYLILTDGCELIVNGGIHINNGSSFTIYAQSEGEDAGVLVANGGKEQAGIGGGECGGGGTLTVNGGSVTATSTGGAGIGGGERGGGGTLTVNGGSVTATSTSGAGIGGGYSYFYGDGGTLTVNGGSVTATSTSGAGIGGGYGNFYGSAATKVTVNGGIVSAESFNGAGIGGGADGDGGTLTVNGGSVTANSTSGAGIGGGDGGGGGTITVNGGSVTTNSKTGAGIGGGAGGDGGTLTVNGGSVTANSTSGAGIGGGYGNPYGGAGAKVTVNGGSVTATSFERPGMGVGGQCIQDGGGGTLIVNGGSATISSGFSRNPGYTGSFCKDDGSEADDLCIVAGNAAGDAEGVTAEEYYNNRTAYVCVRVHNYAEDYIYNGETHYRNCTVCGEPSCAESHFFTDGVCVCGAFQNAKYIVRYWDENEKQVISSEDNVPVSAQRITEETTELGDGWYILSKSVTLPEGKNITVNGDARLILCDGCELKIPSPADKDAAIELTDGGTFGTVNSLTVFGQKNDTGKITVTGSNGSAGIGSAHGDDCGNITVCGGTITAIGGLNGAGIGGGNEKDCGEVTIYGGTVTATGGREAAGIGNGNEGNGGEITIYGGTVKAYGNESRAIGGESSTFYKNKVHIYGGDILADSKCGKDAILTNSVTVYPDTETEKCNAFTVKDFSGNELPGSPVREQKNIASILSGKKQVQINPGVIHTFTGEYVDNGNGTHSRKCSVCGVLYDAENHDFTGDYVNNGDGTHSRKCVCGELGIPEAHTYEDSVCVCGAYEYAKYRYYDEESKEFKTGICNEYEVIDKNNKPTALETGKWYVVKGEPVITGNVMVSGEVHLILTDESTLTVNGTISGENANLYIYAQSTGDTAGKLVCSGSAGTNAAYRENEPGIVGGNGGNAISVAELTINGGSVSAAGGKGGAGAEGSCDEYYGTGLRGGDGGIGGNAIAADVLTINSGNVTATGGKGGSGGTGGHYDGYYNVFAPNSDEYGANGGNGGIGGNAVSVTSLTVTDGTVLLSGGDGGAGANGGNGGVYLKAKDKYIVGGHGGGGGQGGSGLSATSLTVADGTVSLSGGNGGKGGNGGSGGSEIDLDHSKVYGGNGSGGGKGGSGLSVTSLTVADGTVLLSGGDGGNGGNGGNGGVSHSGNKGDDGVYGASTELAEGGVIDGTVTVKANEADSFIPLPSGESVRNYQFAKITKTYETPLKIRSASLRISEDINVIYAAEVPEGCTNPYMVFTLNDRTYTVDTYTVNSKGQYCFELEAVTPQHMGDNISATLYATVDGCTASVTKAEYSVRAYCVSMLAKTNDDLFVTLLSDLLTYGAAAQTYTNYKTDALVTDGLDLSPSTFPELSGLKEEFVGTADPDTIWKSASLTLRNNVDMNLCFHTDSLEDLSVVLEINGRTETVTDFAPVDGEEGLYQITFHGILATEFDLPVSASFYRDGAQVGNTLNYSVNTYICSKQNDSNAALATMVQALYNYGATANTYYFERYLKQ